MKKFIVVSILIIMVFSMTIMAFAEATQDVPQWFYDMITWKKAEIDEAVKDKTITEEQAKLWNQRLDYMKKYHEENGFNFPGGCGGTGRGLGGGMMGRSLSGGISQGWNSQGF